MRGSLQVLFLDVPLRFAHDARHHGDGLHRILAHRRLAGEHHGVGAVINGVGHVGNFGARGPRILDHRLEHLRRRDHRLEILRRAADDVLLNRGNLLRRNFNAQIAARHHDAVGGLQNAVEMLDGLRLFELGDDPGLAAIGRNAIAHQAHIFRGAHKRNGDRVHAILERKLEILRILFGQRRNAHRNAGQIDALVFAQHAAVDDLADHVGADHFVHAQLDQSVGKQNARALLNVFRQRLESGAHQRCRSGNIARSDGQPLTGLQQHRLVILQLRGADLGALQIAEDAERLALFAAHFADHLDERQLFLVSAVGKIQAHHIDAGADQLAKNRLGVRSGSERGDNLCAALDRDLRSGSYQRTALI